MNAIKLSTYGLMATVLIDRTVVLGAGPVGTSITYQGELTANVLFVSLECATDLCSIGWRPCLGARLV